MAALISPGVSVTVIDESQYQPTAQGTIAYVLLATDQDKINPSGTTATYTTKANANKLVKITSQRELVSGFGSINFQLDSSGNPIHAHELNEYGLLAAYSALGVANQLYIQRADVNLSELTGTSIRPTGNAADGTYWLDLTTTNWGVTEWTELGFVLQTPTVITDVAHLSGGVPLSSFGAIGTYAVVATSSSNPIYFKRFDNTWVLVGSDDWQVAVPTIVGQAAAPTLSIGTKMVLNNVNVTLTGTSVSSAASDINSALSGKNVSATVNVAGQIELRINSMAASSGNLLIPNGELTIAKGSEIGGTDCAVTLGLFVAADGTANVKTVFGPTVTFDTYRNAPAWRTSDATPRPTGSVWFKTSATGNGANWGIKEYNANLDSWVLQAAPLYFSDTAAINGLDPIGGGGQLGVGTLYVRYDTLGTTTGTFKPYIKNVTGLVKVTGTTPITPLVFTARDKFIMEVSVPGSTVTQSATIELSGTTAQALVGNILGANLPNIVAIVESSGAISISHLGGGTIKFTYVTGTPLTLAGLINDSNVQVVVGGSVYLASPFTALTYTYSTTAPYSNPADGTLWYYNSALEVDIMINDGSGWKGYKNVVNDARGYDLS